MNNNWRDQFVIFNVWKGVELKMEDLRIFFGFKSSKYQICCTFCRGEDIGGYVKKIAF
jgi:hypothetical protein